MPDRPQGYPARVGNTDSMTTPLAAQRRRAIAEYVRQHDWVTVQELRVITHASSSTIRRDLHCLAKQNLLSHVHGGAISLRAETETGRARYTTFGLSNAQGV